MLTLNELLLWTQVQAIVDAEAGSIAEDPLLAVVTAIETGGNRDYDNTLAQLRRCRRLRTKLVNFYHTSYEREAGTYRCDDCKQVRPWGEVEETGLCRACRAEIAQAEHASERRVDRDWAFGGAS